MCVILTVSRHLVPDHLLECLQFRAALVRVRELVDGPKGDIVPGPLGDRLLRVAIRCTTNLLRSSVVHSVSKATWILLMHLASDTVESMAPLRRRALALRRFYRSTGGR